MPPWFLQLNGVALVVMGITLFAMRVRQRPFHQHFLGLVWAVFCFCAGVTLLLMAQGFVPQPGASGAGEVRGGAAKKPSPGLEFPSGR